MKEYYFCPKCEVQIKPIVITPNSLKVLKFLTKLKDPVKKYTISSAVMNKYGHSCSIILENLHRDGLIDLISLKKRLNPTNYYVYFKINKLGRSIVKRWKKNIKQNKPVKLIQKRRSVFLSSRKNQQYISVPSKEAI